MEGADETDPAALTTAGSSRGLQFPVRHLVNRATQVAARRMQKLSKNWNPNRKGRQQKAAIRDQSDK